MGQADNDDPRPYLEVAAADSIKRLEKYMIDPIGRKGDLQRLKPFADFRADGWYHEPLVAGKAVWTSIHNWVDAPEMMANGAGIPIRRDGRLVGVADSSNRLPFRVVGGRGVRLPFNGTGELVRFSPFGIATAMTGGSW